jgi:hypothetical protein
MGRISHGGVGALLANLKSVDVFDFPVARRIPGL